VAVRATVRASALVAALVLSAFPATAGASIGKKFGKSGALHDSFATALGSTFSPRGISLKVLTDDPNLESSITYSMECWKSLTKPRGIRFDDGGYNTVGATTLRLPQTVKRAAKCIVSVTAVPFDNAKPPRLQLFARHPHRK
jgi:hypothetical protein